MKEKRSEKIEAKCTKTEYDKVLKMASDNNMSIAELVRARVFYDHAPKYDLFQFRAMKILSSLAAYLQVNIDDFSEDKFAEFEQLLIEFKKRNDVSDELANNDPANNAHS